MYLYPSVLRQGMDDTLTPAMQQYAYVKKKHPDCIILFRMGDFYETFYDDAKTCAKELEITLTSRGKGEKRAPLAGIPYHALDQYLAKLIKKGYKVAICEQLEDSKKAKGIVKRDVVRIVTPGTIIESDLLDAKTNNYIASIYPQGDQYGIAYVDISTGEFRVLRSTSLLGDLGRLQPAECLIPASFGVNEDIRRGKFRVEAYPDHFFTLPQATAALCAHFSVASPTALGLEEPSLVQAAGGLLHYVKETQKCSLPHITKIKQETGYLHLDVSTIRNLEVFKNIKDNTTYGTLFWVLDKTQTPMGARLLKQWMLHPLLSAEKINERLAAVEELMSNARMRQQLAQALHKIQDIERLAGKITYNTVLPRELLALAQSLQQIPSARNALQEAQAPVLKSFLSLPSCDHIAATICKALLPEPPFSLREGHIFAKGYHGEVDALREAAGEGKTWIATLEQKERERTGIKNLKIGFTDAFGYFIFISKGQMEKVPSDYIRKQTLVNGERYVTPELKEKEELILHAEERMCELEYTLYMDLLAQLQKEIRALQEVAAGIAQLDVFFSFAEDAREFRYVKPKIREQNIFHLQEARHPVVERLESRYVPHTIALSEDARTIILTGPNMSGKSTLMRSIALIQLLAQMGCFVPCSNAELGIVDKIFSRIGAYDDVTHGQSTFMVEMLETANILHNATEKSLVILDELGRGTSTFDGIALAYAVAVHLHTVSKAKTLFATHYHQLNNLAERLPGVRNYHMKIKERGEDIIFLRELAEGGTDKSYGIHVAKLAGVPAPVIALAKEFMAKLELDDTIKGKVMQRDENIETLKKFLA